MQLQEYLNQNKVAFKVIEHSPTYDAQHMAQAVHTPGHEVAKTVLLRAGDTYIVAIVAADQQIDLEKVQKAIGGRQVALASEVEIGQRCPDCEVGVLPPFGSQYGMKTLLEKSLTEDDEEVVFEGNTHRESIRMKLDDFRRLESPLISSIVH